MHRVYSNQLPGQQRIHVELTPEDIKDLLDDLNENHYFAPTQAFLGILRTAHEMFTGVPAAATVRDAARTASGQQPETTPWITDGRHGPTPEEMAAAVKRRSVATVDPAVCPRCKGDNQEAFELCADCADPTTADDPTPLRWGLGDVLWGDDDTVTICLSGPDREPYWLELEPEQAAALRDDLAGPDGQDDIGSEGPDPCSACPTFPCRKCAPAVGQPAEAQATDEARLPREQWRVEIYDPVAEEWAPGVAFSECDRAAERLNAVPTYSPRWGTDTPPRRRLVRETTTWTVEDETR